ncbi:MAG: SDR family NAD(P)-dependent oxidoreductase [Anaerolineae bacterium]|nr:MAG: SDR family NAD(P)-dependent oxidoreductase [Anaerolineae bacterium]
MTLSPDLTPLTPRKRAVLVGASSGIGAALARELAHRGYALALLARRAGALDALCREINAAAGDTRAVAYTHDVTDYELIPALFQKLLADLGRIDSVVYAAGVMPTVTFTEYNFDKDKAMVDSQLLGALAWLGQAAALFERMGEGQIVGIASVAGDRGRVLNPGYGAAKAGFVTYLESLRNRLTRRGVNVLTIKPGRVDTEMSRAAGMTRGLYPVGKTAAAIARAMHKRKQVVYIPGWYRFLMLGIIHTPSFIFRRLKF